MKPALKTQPDQPKNESENAAPRIFREFRKAYADCMQAELTNEEWEKVAQIRQLEWKADAPLSLADAARCYGQMATSYNEFRPGMIKSLHKQFPDAGIQVTAAREYSVAAYLHVPDAPGLRQKVEAFVLRRFKADSVEWQADSSLRCWWD
jgi:hypothetical protein